MIRIFLAVDIRLFREGLAQLLTRKQHVRIIGSADGRDGIVAGVRASQADIVLLDIAMAGSVELVRTVLAAVPGVKVIALGVRETEDEIISCAEAGIVGYVPRDGSTDDLIATMESVAEGGTRCSPQIAAALVRRVAMLSAERRAEDLGASLTPRQLEIVRLIGEGLSNKEIARRLCIELSTVKNHVHTALEKLGTHRRAEAAALVRREGLTGASGVSRQQDLDLRV